MSLTQNVTRQQLDSCLLLSTHCSVSPVLTKNPESVAQTRQRPLKNDLETAFNLEGYNVPQMSIKRDATTMLAITRIRNTQRDAPFTWLIHQSPACESGRVMRPTCDRMSLYNLKKEEKKSQHAGSRLSGTRNGKSILVPSE